MLTISAMIYGYTLIKKSSEPSFSLPIIGENKIDGSAHDLLPFSLINQDGKIVTDKDYLSRIYVTDFFFATCQSICPVMSDQMERVARHFRNNPNVMFLSHTVKPEEDSVPVLKEYAKLHGADSLNWNFVTGENETITRLAIKSYMLVDSTTEFVHTQYFALIDPQKRIRGYYDGTDSTAINRLIKDIEGLLKNNE